MTKTIFHRVMILSCIAIGSLVFAVDSSRVVLQAIQIRETAVVIGWSSIEGATQYRAYYDEESAIKDDTTDPLFDTDFTQENQMEVKKLLPDTAYYFIVRGYDENGNSVGSSYPLHAHTYRSTIFDLSVSPFFQDETTLVLNFSRPIKPETAELALVSDISGEEVSLTQKTNSDTDYRVLFITLGEPVKSGQSYTLNLKNITAFGNIPFPREHTAPLKIIYTPHLETSVDVVSTIDDKLVPADDDQKYDEPVLIDSLPRTGPSAFLYVVLAFLSVLFVTKKLSKRA